MYFDKEKEIPRSARTNRFPIVSFHEILITHLVEGKKTAGERADSSDNGERDRPNDLSSVRFFEART